MFLYLISMILAAVGGLVTVMLDHPLYLVGAVVLVLFRPVSERVNSILNGG
jgi:hypothetical protein